MEKALSICQRAWENPPDDPPDFETDIYLWPDGTWVLVEEYKASDFSHMSDDFERVTVLDSSLS